MRLFVKILTPDEMCSLSVKASVQPNQFKENFVEIEKHFLNFFLHFRNLNYILNTLKKKWASEVISFWNYRLKKAGLLKCLKSPVSEHLWAVNMLSGPKHCLNQHRSIFFVFFHQYEKNELEKFCLSSNLNLETFC